MTTDDLRDIEDAIHDYAGRAIHIGTQYLPELDKLLALIRQKLPQTDAEHERAVEAWHEEAMGCTYLGYKCLRVVSIAAIDDGVRLMRARPAVEPHTFSGLPDTTYEKLVAKEKAAGELLRAARTKIRNEASNNACEDYAAGLHRAADIIEAAERAGGR